jgi:bifunctional non-homologous end joining protein LigD
MPSERHPLKVDGRVVDITNPGKVLYPKSGTTKAQVIDYHIQVAPALLPHMRDRPVSMKRYPDGVEAGYFFQKEAPVHRPEWMKTFPVPSDRKGSINYLLCNDLPSLVWLANAADLELHTFMHRVPKVGQPTMMVFDLDPGLPANAIDCCKVALWLRDDLRALGLKAWPKVSGGKGVQMHVPFNVPGITYEHTGGIAKVMAQLLERDHPKEVTSVMRKDLRGGKVFIDWSQNNEHKTTVCVYSLRAQPTPTVAAPLTWAEVEEGADAKDPATLRFSPQDVLTRIEDHGDLMEPVLTTKQKLPTAMAPDAAEGEAKPKARPARKATAKKAVVKTR